MSEMDVPAWRLVLSAHWVVSVQCESAVPVPEILTELEQSPDGTSSPVSVPTRLQCQWMPGSLTVIAVTRVIDLRCQITEDVNGANETVRIMVVNLRPLMSDTFTDTYTCLDQWYMCIPWCIMAVYHWSRYHGYLSNYTEYFLQYIFCVNTYM